MATDDSSATAVTISKRPISRKHRIHSHIQSAGKPRTDEVCINRTSTARNRPSSKLPNLLATASIYSSAHESIYVKRHRSQQRDLNASPSPKLERQSTTVNSQTRLPTLYSLTSDFDQKRTSEFRRRQIYALNHFMRDLEQEQFRQFCTLQSVNTDKHEDTDSDNKDTKKDVLT